MNNKNPKRGMSVIGILLAVLIAASVTVIGVTSYKEVRDAAERTRVQEFTTKINQAVSAYVLSGGVIDEDDSAISVIGKLKKTLSAEYSRLTTGVGDMAARNINLISMGSSNTRAVIVFIDGEFEYRAGGAGFLVTVGEESQVETAQITVDGLTYNPNETGWIWKEDSANGPSVIAAANKQLLPPEFLYSGSVPMGSFPLTDIMEYPANPSGTTYHYTIDGSAPSSSSAQWINPAVTIASLPPAYRAIAVHPSSEWLDSPIAQTTIFASLEITYGREDGSEETSFVFGDVIGNTNRIVLDVPGVDSADYKIYYTSDGTIPTTASTEYLGAYHFQAIWWPESGLPLQAKAFSQAGGMVSDSSVLARDLMPIPTRLPTPEYDIDPTSGPVASGTNLNITNALTAYSTFKSDYGDEIPSDTAPHAEIIPVVAP